MGLSGWLNPTPRDVPRRGVGVDLRPATRQARILFGVVPFVLAALGIASDFRPGSAAFGLKAGVLAAAAFNIVAWTRSLRFEDAHADEPAEFWARHEAYIRPRAFAGFCAALPLGLLGAAVGLLVGAVAIAAFCAVVAAYSLVLIVIMAGKIP
jgi:hypothetical protein